MRLTMRKNFLVTLLFATLSVVCLAEKVIVPITGNGAFAIRNQPASIYHNGKTFFSWITNSGSLQISSYDHVSDEVKLATVASGYGIDDLASPTLLIRASGQVLIFASKNGQETNMQCFRSTSTTGDITQGFSTDNLTGYGISQSLAFAMGDNIVVLWRSKNNLGYTFYAGENAVGKTGSLSAGGTKRTGFLGDAGFGNNYTLREEVPVMCAKQDNSHNIHIAITQLGTGLKYNNSTIHYLKAVNDNNSGLKFQKASGADAGAITYATPPDVVYATSSESEKAIAYDIAIVDGKPAILYDAFNGVNVNATTNPGSSSNHTYKIALWNGTQWVSNAIANIGDGLKIAQYTTVGGKIFNTNSYQAGGICFDVNDANTVYLSKKENPGVFELYKYQTSDGGLTWTQAEVITQASTEANIRPIQVANSPLPRAVDLLWMRGSYTSPTVYDVSIVSRGEAMPVSSINFEQANHYLLINESIKLHVKFSPLFVINRDVVLESDNTNVAEITSDGMVKAKSVGIATITAKAMSNPSLTTTCQVVVESQSVFDVMTERIISEAYADRISLVADLDNKVGLSLTNLQSNGSFPDVNYAATDRTDWPPMVHLNRMLEMALAYTYSSSAYFQDAVLKTKLDLMLQFWLSAAPSSNNWYQNEIGEPQRMGLFLLLVQFKGAEQLPSALLNNAIARLKNKGGNPGAQAGANRVDVALHWVYRACLTKDRDLLQTALEYIYSPIEYTASSEGIQYDNSFTQHGRQLHIGAYGDVFLDGITKAASYAAGSPYALSAAKQKILSSLVKDTYISAFRGGNIFFNVIGRSVTRPGVTGRAGKNAIIQRMMLIDPANVKFYEDALARIKGEEPSSFGLSAKSTHYFKTDYTLHQRPSYSVDLRMVSSRTARNEYLKDNGEGIKQYFMSDGATGIFVDGDEYYNIFPVWNWAKIPGTTTAEFVDIPQANSYILAGSSSMVGGVSDSLNSVSVYKYTDAYNGTNYSGSSSSANKAYFFFDKELVCLGNSIKSTAPFNVNTTVNQTLLKGDVTVSSNGNQSVLSSGTYTFDNNIDWAYHNKVAYYFPNKGKLDLTAKEQVGNWMDINTNYPEYDTVRKDVFSLSFNHGLQPEASGYAYIVVPGVADVDAAAGYNASSIEIVANNDSVQAVYNNELDMLGVVFYRAASISTKGAFFEVDAPCVMMIKSLSGTKPVLHVADSQNGSNPIKLAVSTPSVTDVRLITYQVATPFQGSSRRFVIDNNLPLYTGKDVLLNRSDWTIVASSVGPVDAAVAPAGDVPYYIIDGDNQSAFLFVKPGKNFGGVAVPADVKPWFEIDMKQSNEMTYLLYRHRDFNNTSSSLRASKASFYGKDAELDEYQSVVTNFNIPTDATEIRIDLPNKVKYRYVKFLIEAWDAVTSNTIQVSEFNIGTNQFVGVPTEIERKDLQQKASLSPCPAKAGEPLFVRLNDELRDAVLSVFSLSGVRVASAKAVGTVAELTLSNKGVYFIDVRKNGISTLLKTIVN